MILRTLEHFNEIKENFEIKYFLKNREKIFLFRFKNECD